MTKDNIYNALILSTLVSFGSFGSLSHLFSLALIILMIVDYTKSDEKNDGIYKSILLFYILSGSFFLFFLTSLFHTNLRMLLAALSPMLPIPLIGLLIIFQKGMNFKITSKKLSQFSQISILFSLIAYLLLLAFSNPESDFYNSHSGRVKLFSGNPIPFSFCMFGISIFCLADWRNSSKISNLIAFLFFLTGIYFATILSGTRGTFVSFIVVLPIIIFYISKKFTIRLSVFSIFGLVIILVFATDLGKSVTSLFSDRIKNGLETIVHLENHDHSIWQRLDMWSAGQKAFIEAPLLGHGITERFTALKPYLKNSEINYTHPHSDITAGLVSSGIFGGIAVLISLMSAVIAAILAPKWSHTKLYFSLMITCSAMITGNVSTVLFNDISSAWLVFSTYLIWKTDFLDEFQNQKI